MLSLARSSLIHEWRRYLAAVLAVSFSGLLVLVQIALLLGMFGTVSSYIDHSTADVWMGYRNTESVDMGRGIPISRKIFLHQHPKVSKVERVLMDFGDWRRSDGAVLSVYLVGLDPMEGGMILAKKIPPRLRAALYHPDAVIVDQADVEKLGAKVGAVAEINSRRVRVVGVIKGMRAIGGANVICSMRTAEKLIDSSGFMSRWATYFVASLEPGSDVNQVVRDLEPKGLRTDYSVWDAKGFSLQSQTYWLLESGAGAASGFASVLGILVGVLITSQTLRGAILSSLKEYATLRALGVSLGSLRMVVLEQSFWVGVAGLIITGLATWMIAWLASQAFVAIALPLWLLIAVGLMMLAIAMGSGLLSVRPLFRAEPADLLR
jgi:putative ABC transport system permease protein